MKQTRDRKKTAPAEAIAKMADGGEDGSRFFANRGKTRQLIQRVIVDFFVASMPQELGRTAAELNVSREALDRHHPAPGVRKAR